MGYDIDESLPWHSTLSRTRKSYGQELFLEVFREVLHLCVLKGMVDGRRQALDSAFIKSNASMDSLVEKKIEKETVNYLQELTLCEETEQQPLDKKRKQGKQVSTTDPDARLSMKKGKPFALNFSGQISVDTASHVICGAMADFADKRDAQTLANILGQTADTLQQENIPLEEVLADTNYSSGSSLRYLEEHPITGYIPFKNNNTLRALLLYLSFFTIFVK